MLNLEKNEKSPIKFVIYFLEKGINTGNKMNERRNMNINILVLYIS